MRWLDEVMAWKQRFEKLFPPAFIKSADFKKAEMRKLEKILSYPRAKLNEDERLSRKLVRQQYIQLERERYPNPFVRLARNMGKLGWNAMKWTGKGVARLFGSGVPVRAVALKDSDLRAMLKKDLETGKQKSRKTIVAPATAGRKQRNSKLVKMDVSDRIVSRGKRI